MLLHQQFVRNAKSHSKKFAIKDKTTKSDVTYGRALDRSPDPCKEI